MLAFIRSRQPRDEFEATMLSQMAATQLAIMRFTNQLAHAETLQEQDSAERTLNKLMRTFNLQVETFQRYRFVNERRALIQHLSVSHGGQAISGNVSSPVCKSEAKKRCGIDRRYCRMHGKARCRSSTNRTYAAGLSSGANTNDA